MLEEERNVDAKEKKMGEGVPEGVSISCHDPINDGAFSDATVFTVGQWELDLNSLLTFLPFCAPKFR